MCIFAVHCITELLRLGINTSSGHDVANCDMGNSTVEGPGDVMWDNFTVPLQQSTYSRVWLSLFYSISPACLLFC